MAVLALVGITSMYLSQIRRNGVLGLVGYALPAAGYLLILCDVYARRLRVPRGRRLKPRFRQRRHRRRHQPRQRQGRHRALKTVTQVRGAAYLAGGLLFGIALYRAHVLARWAATFLAVDGVISVALSPIPDAF